MIERHIDYLQFSLPLSEKNILDLNWKPVSSIQFYKRGFQDENGARYYFGNPNSKRALVVCSGQCLEIIRGNGLSDGDICERYLSRGAKVSRIDLAVTDYIEDDFCTVDDVRQWYKEGLVESTLTGYGNKTLSQITGEGEQIETFYIGAMERRSKQGLFRAYDKGVQMALEPEICTRLEVEIRQDKAHSTAKRLGETSNISGNFRASFNVASPQFERLMDSEAAVIPVRGKGDLKREENERMAKRWQWLINQVAPALKEAVKYDREHNDMDINLVKFMVAAGLMKEVRGYAENLSHRKFLDYLNDNDILMNSDN